MIRNRVICVVAFAVALVVFILTNNAAALALAVFAVFVPAASIALGAFTCAHTKLAFELAPSCSVGQSLEMKIAVKRPVMYRSQIELAFSCRNSMTGEETELSVSLAPAPRKTESYLLAVPTQSCGHVCIALKSARAVDSLGFCAPYIKEARFDSSYVVFPELAQLNVVTDKTSRESLVGTAYDHHRKGQDSTEVFEIRDFHDGDSLKSVHWKVSARLDDLVVREGSHPMDYDIALLSGIHAVKSGDPASLAAMNACMTMLASISLALVRKGLGHSVSFNGPDGIQRRYVDDIPSFNELLDVLMSMPLVPGGKSYGAVMEHMETLRDVSKSILVSDVVDELLFSKITSLTSLSVIHMSQDGNAALEELGTYSLLHIPVADVPARVKNLEL